MNVCPFLFLFDGLFKLSRVFKSKMGRQKRIIPSVWRQRSAGAVLGVRKAGSSLSLLHILGPDV